MYERANDETDRNDRAGFQTEGVPDSVVEQNDDCGAKSRAEVRAMQQRVDLGKFSREEWITMTDNLRATYAEAQRSSNGATSIHANGWEQVKFLLMLTGIIAIVARVLIFSSPGAKGPRFTPVQAGSPYMYDKQTGVVCDAWPVGNQHHPEGMPYCKDLD
jgi:hypothetical protein